LQQKDYRFQIIKIDQGASVPNIIDRAQGLVFMGGPMSVNDDLPWITPTLELIRTAHAHSVPILGHCLGGQIIAKALGSSVGANPLKEIGWFPVRCRASFPSLAEEIEVFHWHGETFTLPDGVQHLFESDACHNQGFRVGNTMALQFHAEMLADMVPVWANHYAEEIAKPTATVQGFDAMTRDLDQRIAQLHRVADAIYDVWSAPLA
jgi:GMP synthase-like glutamine amidotransferase